MQAIHSPSRKAKVNEERPDEEAAQCNTK